jgi:Cdc6-like AAA superfamily ATPase
MTGGAEGYTDSQLQNVLDRNTSALTGVVNYNLAAREVWSWLAAKYAQLVDTSESGSTRKLSDLHKHALTMVSQYTPADGVVEVVEPVRPRTRPIVRP